MAHDEMEELKRMFREGKQRLQDMKDDKEAFDNALKVVGTFLDDAKVALECGDSKASQREFRRALESMHFLIKGALELAPAFKTSEGKTTLDKINNLRIDCWNWGKRLEREYEAYREAIGYPACPVMIAEGVARVSSEMVSEKAVDFCLNECKYQDRCNPVATPSQV